MAAAARVQPLARAKAAASGRSTAQRISPRTFVIPAWSILTSQRTGLPAASAARPRCDGLRMDPQRAGEGDIGRGVDHAANDLPRRRHRPGPNRQVAGR